MPNYSQSNASSKEHHYSSHRNSSEREPGINDNPTASATDPQVVDSATADGDNGISERVIVIGQKMKGSTSRGASLDSTTLLAGAPPPAGENPNTINHAANVSFNKQPQFQLSAPCIPTPTNAAGKAMPGSEDIVPAAQGGRKYRSYEDREQTSSANTSTGAPASVYGSLNSSSGGRGGVVDRGNVEGGPAGGAYRDTSTYHTTSYGNGEAMNTKGQSGGGSYHDKNSSSGNYGDKYNVDKGYDRGGGGSSSGYNNEKGSISGYNENIKGYNDKGYNNSHDKGGSSTSYDKYNNDKGSSSYEKGNNNNSSYYGNNNINNTSTSTRDHSGSGAYSVRENYHHNLQGVTSAHRRDDNVPVPWRCLVPAPAAGPIVGKAGENLKTIVSRIGDVFARVDVTKDGELANLEDKMLIIRASTPENKLQMCRYVLQKVEATLHSNAVLVTKSVVPVKNTNSTTSTAGAAAAAGEQSQNQSSTAAADSSGGAASTQGGTKDSQNHATSAEVVQPESKTTTEETAAAGGGPSTLVDPVLIKSGSKDNYGATTENNKSSSDGATIVVNPATGVDPSTTTSTTQTVIERANKPMRLFFCLCIPQLVIASVLGVRGEKIKEIIHKSRIDKVDLPKSPSFGTDFVLRLVGDMESILVATTMIYEIVQAVANEARLSERDFTVKPKMYSNLQLVKESQMMPNFLNTVLSPLQVTQNFKFLVSKNEASWMIGRNGNVILDLRKHSGATFEVKELNNMGEQRLVEIGGVYQFKLAGVELFVKCLETCAQRTFLVNLLVPTIGIERMSAKSMLTEVRKASNCIRVDMEEPGPTTPPLKLEFASSVRSRQFDEKLHKHEQWRKIVIQGSSYEQLRIATQMLTQKLEEAITHKDLHIGTMLEPESLSRVRLFLSREEVGWIIGKGGKVMKDIRRTSGASTYIHDVASVVTASGSASSSTSQSTNPGQSSAADAPAGTNAQQTTSSEQQQINPSNHKIVEIQGRLEAILSCLELMLRVAEKFQNRQSTINIVLEKEMILAGGGGNGTSTANTSSPALSSASEKEKDDTAVLGATTGTVADATGARPAPTSENKPATAQPTSAATSASGAWILEKVKKCCPSQVPRMWFQQVEAIAGDNESNLPMIQIEGHNDAGRRCAMVLCLMLAEYTTGVMRVGGGGTNGNGGTSAVAGAPAVGSACGGSKEHQIAGSAAHLPAAGENIKETTTATTTSTTTLQNQPPILVTNTELRGVGHVEMKAVSSNSSSTAGGNIGAEIMLQPQHSTTKQEGMAGVASTTTSSATQGVVGKMSKAAGGATATATGSCPGSSMGHQFLVSEKVGEQDLELNDKGGGGVE
ncbi:unnamed protein product [Amoebophrya sp. A120]|nr:unnamed protein product [Amoebophrya sp. A120]|eukprot:GSA120T00013264001.1